MPEGWEDNGAVLRFRRGLTTDAPVSRAEAPYYTGSVWRWTGGCWIAWMRGWTETVATITLVYPHHARLLPGRLTAAQHDHYSEIVSSLHVHLDHDHCLEVLVVRGRAKTLRALADRMIATRGVKHGRLTMATIGKDLP